MTAPTLPVFPHVAPTAHDAALLGQVGLHEWVDGVLVEKRMSPLAGRVTSRLHGFVAAAVATDDLGDLMIAAVFRCFPNRPGQVRRPGISFVSAGRTHLVPRDGYVPVRPDLAVEVLSDGDNVYEWDRRLQDYAAAEIPLVWVVNPDVRTVRVVRPDGSSVLVGEAGILDGGVVLPGFRVAVRDLFPRPR